VRDFLEFIFSLCRYNRASDCFGSFHCVLVRGAAGFPHFHRATADYYYWFLLFGIQE